MTHPAPIEAAAPGLAPALVAAFSDLQVLAILNHLPADRQAAILTGGFQLTPASAGNPQIRKRLARMLEQRPELLRWASEMTPAPWQETLQVLTMLDAAWLQQEWRSLVRSQALPHLLLAAAFCPERPGLQARACRWFRWRPTSPRPGRPAEPPADWQAWRKLAGATVATPPAPRPEDVKKPVPEPAANARLRKRLEEAEAARKEAEQAALQWKKQAKTAEHAQATLQKNAQAQLECAVATARSELYGYSDDIGQLQQLLAAADQATEPFARQILLRQAEINQRHGTRSALRQERQRLLALQQDLRQAIEESLVVLPELRQAASQIVSRLGEIDKCLVAEPPPVPLFDDFLLQLRTLTPADGQATLEALERLINDLATAGLWPKNTVAEARRALRDQRQRLDSLARGKMPDTFDPGKGRPQAQFSSAWLRPGAPPRPEVRVFIDGYNVIKRNLPFSDIETTRGLAAARRELVARCAAIASQVGHLEIVFDGSDTLQNQESFGNVLVVYSSYQAQEQNADLCLLDRLAAARRDHPDAILALVSDDGGLAIRAVSFKTALVDTATWVALLRRWTGGDHRGG